MVMIKVYWNRNKWVCCELIITRMLGENSISALGWTSADGIGGGVMAADDGLVGALGPPKIFIAHFSTIASSIISGILQHLEESYVWEILINSCSRLNIWKCAELLYLYSIRMYNTIPKIYITLLEFCKWLIPLELEQVSTVSALWAVSYPCSTWHGQDSSRHFQTSLWHLQASLWHLQKTCHIAVPKIWKISKEGCSFSYRVWPFQCKFRVVQGYSEHVSFKNDDGQKVPCQLSQSRLWK